METLYTIDSGNTNLKVSVFSPEGKITEKFKIKSLEELNLPENSLALFCSVNQELQFKNKSLISFNDIKGKLHFPTEYGQSLGNDRLALVYGIQNLKQEENFIAVDAGSFITIDIVKSGIHLGGFIYPGLRTFLKSYNIHGKNLPLIENNIERRKGIAKNTQQAIALATRHYLESIRNHILSFNVDQVYLTGGDALELNLPKAIYDEDLLAKALHYILKEISSQHRAEQ